MAKKQKQFRPKARLPKGLRDLRADDVAARRAMLTTIMKVYESYGFDPLETSAFEYADALGKFLPDADRPNEGVFSFQDDDDQWLSLRYDLTAPLARMVAENYETVPKPFRRYQTGQVWRNEKPGPGRFREFTQCDADSVGAPEMAADAELCAMVSDALEAVGIPRGDYVVRVNNRKILDGVLETIGVPGGEEGALQRMTVLRAIDKLDRLGAEGVKLLLGEGRKDESGDFTKGAGLNSDQADTVLAFVGAGDEDRSKVLETLRGLVGTSETGLAGVAELEEIATLLDATGYGPDRILFDPAVVRGLGYYTGPVFEAELTFDVKDEKGNPIRFGSIGGGGRYDDLVSRFKGTPIPATGVSIGVDRLLSALEVLGRNKTKSLTPPVVVLPLDKDRMADYQRMVFDLRNAGIRAEMYLGGAGMRAQLKYADKRGAPVAVIQGSDEFEKGEITLKDLVLGAELSKEIEDNTTWREDQPAQVSVSADGLIQAVKDMLARPHMQA
ncbi:histidine--tRNA ligase [Pyruvatibacter sp. HU-CL02332]|uniref:histidine--tRNA ligase n=1 Tax=Pyruvatibacter sp. HU-CL02332 TaxID=3127650 RepID=UPI003108EC94